MGVYLTMKTTAHKLAILAGTAIWLVGTTAQAQDRARAPISGTVTLDAGFTPDPKIVSVTSGGRHDVSRSIGGSCTGFVSGAPDVRVNYRTASTLPLIFSAESSTDTTLVINAPDGQWYCNDDTNGVNPQIRFDNPNTGAYEIWVGTYGGREQIPARLFISEVGEAVVEPVYVPTMEPGLSPTFSTVSLSAGFTPDPRQVGLTTSGSVDGSTVSSGCNGYYASAPDVTLNYQAGSLPLILSANSGRDTTIMVNGPQGDWYCDDDSGEGSNPSLRFNNPQSGEYDIWIGSYSGDSVDATLYISEVRSQ